MVQALSAFMDFCYLVQQNLLDESTLDAINVAITKFHASHVIFEDIGIHSHFSLPHQHSVKHFWVLIQMFSAPNGLCSSIMESKHIKAVKEPYRWSSHFEALGQMLLTNQRIDKLAAYHVSVTVHNMLDGPCLAPGVLPVLPLPPLPVLLLPPLPLLPFQPLPLLLLPLLPRHDPDADAVNVPRAIARVSLARN